MIIRTVLLCWMASVAVMAGIVAAAGGKVAGKQQRRPNRVPLFGEVMGGRRNRKHTVCHFGSRTYELEDVWHPDLGSPFGVLYCMQCECVPIQRKQRIIGKVRCRNIKYECPKPNCEDPVLRPGKCCKLCLENIGDGTAVEEDNMYSRYGSVDEDERASNEFAAMLTGQAIHTAVRTSSVGFARFSFHRRNLHFSVHYDGPERVRSIRFLDMSGNILEEHEVDREEVTSSPAQVNRDEEESKQVCHANTLALPNNMGQLQQVCGVWRRLPKVHRKLLREDKLFLLVTTDSNPEGVVSGRVSPFASLAKETYGAILKPAGEDEELRGGGGIAVIASNSEMQSVHVMVAFSGIFTGQDVSNIPVKIKLTRFNEADSILDETLILPKQQKERNVIELSSSLKPSVFQHLLMGDVSIEISSRAAPHRVLTGIVTVRRSCNVFQAILSSSDSLESPQPKTGAAGLALFNLNLDGSLSYVLQVSGLTGRPTSLTLEETNKRKQRVIDDLLPSFNDNWANGTCRSLKSRDLEDLLSEDVWLNVATREHTSELRGKVTQRLYSDALTAMPILLTGQNTTAAGHAWAAVDKSCKLYYQVVVVGLGQPKRLAPPTDDELHYVELVELPGRTVAGEKRVLQEFHGNEVEDIVEDLSKVSLARLDSGVTYLQVMRNGSDPEALRLRGRIRNLQVPAVCLPRLDDSEEDYVQEDEIRLVGSAPKKCYFEGRVIQEGTQWQAEHDACMMCSCQKGRVICDPVVCPPLICQMTVQLPGECCRACADINQTSLHMETAQRGCWFEGDRKFHKGGSQWHPYLPPFGFSKCAVCSCNAVTLTVECNRTTCPPLPCKDKEAIRDPPDACCKKCPVRVRPVANNPDEQLDEEMASSDRVLSEGACSFVGEMRENGEEWYPRLRPYGEEKCVRCSCKDGKSRCKRQKCPVLQCQHKIKEEDSCCYKCADANTILKPPKRNGKRKKVKNVNG